MNNNKRTRIFSYLPVLIMLFGGVLISFFLPSPLYRAVLFCILGGVSLLPVLFRRRLISDEPEETVDVALRTESVYERDNEEFNDESDPGNEAEEEASPVDDSIIGDARSSLTVIHEIVEDSSVDRITKKVLNLTNECRPRLKSLDNNANIIQENVSQSFSISDNLSKTAQEAFDLAEKVQKGIGSITDILGRTMNFAENLDIQSQQISKILEIMSNISSQIHVLGINASIVSARAGSHGRGFEVVAKEIRKLAEETDNSLSDIDNQVNNIQDSIQMVFSEVQKANSETANETQSLITVAGSLQGVLLAVEVINTVSTVARDRVEEQNTQISSIVDSIETIISTMEQLNEAEQLKSTDFSRECEKLGKSLELILKQ